MNHHVIHDFERRDLVGFEREEFKFLVVRANMAVMQARRLEVEM